MNFVFTQWLRPTYAGKKIRNICLKFSQPAPLSLVGKCVKKEKGEIPIDL